MPADTGTKYVVIETDRMRLIDAELRQRGIVGLRRFIADRWADGEGGSWDDIALELRTALKDSPYDGTPRETVIKYALRYGVIADRGQRSRKTPRRDQTTRMAVIDQTLRDAGHPGLQQQLETMHAAGDSWDDIALALRGQLKDTPYARLSRETAIRFARRYGILPAQRPKGSARVRRPRTTK